MAVEITPERVAAAAARLHDGGWSFTPRQLYYAVCRDVETVPIRVAPGELSLGVLLILIGAITGNRTLIFGMGALGLVLVAIGGVTHVVERRRRLPDSRVLVTSYDAFVRDHVAGTSFVGMVGDAASTDAAETNGATLVVVCDRTDTAAMLHANAARIGDGAVVVTAAPGATTTPVVVVHDASPAGATMLAATRAGNAGAADAGLNPADVVDSRPQLIEGAPVHIDDAHIAHLSLTEQAFLRDGRRVELATLTPEETVVRIRAAVGQSNAV